MIRVISFALLCALPTSSYAEYSTFPEAEKAFEAAKDLYRDELPLPGNFKGACVYPASFSSRPYRPGQTISFFYKEAKRYLTISESAEFFGSVELEHRHGQMIGSYLNGPTARLNVILKRLTRKQADGREVSYWLVQVPYLAYRNGHFYCFAEDQR
ncbi:hypothetical protein K2X33_16145 [bacterium]|nr:hypothetical protein [bacterium]